MFRHNIRSLTTASLSLVTTVTHARRIPRAVLVFVQFAAAMRAAVDVFARVEC